MKVNYFDLGLHHTAWELEQMRSVVLPKLGIEDYSIYGFEAHPGYCKQVEDRYNDPRIKIINRAISDEEKDIDLYLARNSVGHSIFATKNNVNKSKKVSVKGIVFSKFLEENCPSFKDEVNVLKINIEGVEWHLFNDLIGKGYHDYFLFCGQGHDVEKVRELDSKEYWNLIKENGITLNRFSDYKKVRNADIGDLLKKEIGRRSQR